MEGLIAALRLLFVAQPTSGGTAVVMRALAAGASGLGHRVTVATPDADGTPEWAASLDVDWRELPLDRAPAISDVVRVQQARRLMAGADVVHLHSSKAGAVGRLAARSMRRPPRVVFTPHAWSWYVGGRLAPAYRRFERWAAGAADAITVVSAEELADAHRVLGPDAPITLIENGVDLARFTPDGPRAERRPEPLLVSVGRLSEQKGQDRLLRVLAALPDDSVRLRLVGDGPDRAALAALAGRLGVAGRVEFVGADDPRAHLRAADVVVLASRWEGMSLVLVEAMATGAAVVTTAVGGSGALADAGLVVAGNDDGVVEPRLAAALTELLADPSRRLRFGARARELAVRHHDRTAGLAAYDTVWRGGPV